LETNFNFIFGAAILSLLSINFKTGRGLNASYGIRTMTLKYTEFCLYNSKTFLDMAQVDHVAMPSAWVKE
jgi:hypothetical protein